jgi:hypothetical protein
MKAQFLKIAGVKSEKEFYKKYPTEAAFFKAHPEAKKQIKKAKVGTYIGGDTDPEPQMIDYKSIYDTYDKMITGQTDAERRDIAYKQAMLEAAQNESGGGGSASGGVSGAMGSITNMLGSVLGGSGGGGEAAGGAEALSAIPIRNGNYIPKAQFGLAFQLGNTLANMMFKDKKPVTPVTPKKKEVVYNDIKITDPRKILATTKQPLRPNYDLVGGTYNTEHLNKLVQEAKRQGLSKEDIMNLSAMGFQETKWGRTDSNIGHVLHTGDDPGSFNDYEDFVDAYKAKMKLADDLGIKDPMMRLQVYNGLGVVTPKTEKKYHGFEMQKIYGVPIPKGGISMKQNPLYGKQVTDIRDNVLAKNPEYIKYMDSLINAPLPKHMVDQTVKKSKPIKSLKKGVTPKAQNSIPPIDASLEGNPDYQSPMLSYPQGLSPGNYNDWDIDNNGVPDAIQKPQGNPLISKPDSTSENLSGLTKMAGPVGGIIDGIQELRAERDQAKFAQQQRMLSELQLVASATIPEEKERRYVRAEDMVNTGEPFFPVFGVGTNVLGSARNGAILQGGGMVGGNPTEIQNTYSNGYDIYTHGGYEPLINPHDLKDFRYGGDISKAQNGLDNWANSMSGGGSGFSGAGETGGTPWGLIGNQSSAISQSAMGGENAGGKIGGNVGFAIGSIFGPAGGAIGKFVGSTAGNALDPYARRIRKDSAATEKNIQNIGFNAIGKAINSQYARHKQNGGETPIAQNSVPSSFLKKVKNQKTKTPQTPQREVVRDSFEDRNVLSPNQLYYKSPRGQKEIQEIANPKVVVFAESPKDKPTYRPWDTNLPKELQVIAEQQEEAGAKLDSVMMADKTYKNLSDIYTKLSDAAFDLEMKYGATDPRVKKAYSKSKVAGKKLYEYEGTPKFQEKIKPYEDSYYSFMNKFDESELNPKVIDSTFIKEAQNVKDFYKRTNPEKMVDVVPLYGNQKLMQQKLKGMTPYDKFAIFGHSGDKLAGIDNAKIAQYLKDSKVEDCYFGSCGFESYINYSPFELLSGKTLNYRPSGNLWLGFNPNAKTFDEGMWSRQKDYNTGNPAVLPIVPNESFIKRKLENGGYMNPEYNPQVITMFGDHTAEDFADYAHKYRAGGHLKSYTEPSDRAMETYAMGGQLKTNWGGRAEVVSHNPYMPGSGETVKFKGNYHTQEDEFGNTGIGIMYGDSPVEVENGEPMIELQSGGQVDPMTGEPETTGVIFGNMKLNKKVASQMGDDQLMEIVNRYDGKTFKTVGLEFAKQEEKQNKLIDKTMDIINSFEVKNSIDKAKLAGLEAKVKGGEEKLKNLAYAKMLMANYQNSITETKEEISDYLGKNISAEDLARGYIKLDRDPVTMNAKWGGNIIKKAQNSATVPGKTTTPPKMTRKELIAKGYEQDPITKEWKRTVKKFSTKKSESKSANALGYIPAQKYNKETGFAGGVTKEKFEQFKKRFPDFPGWDGFDWKDPNDLNELKSWFNKEAEKRGSKSRILDDPKTKSNPQGLPIFGDQYFSANFDDVSNTTPAEDEETLTAILDEEAPTYIPETKSRFPWEVLAGQALKYLTPSDQEPFDYNQFLGEYYALASNQQEPVPAQLYHPELGIPYDISYQDILNENQAAFNAQLRKSGYNPTFQSMLQAQKYAANEKVLGEQFRANQAMKAGVYDQNRNILNQAKLTNLNILDKQYERQAQAMSNTKATTQAALNSMSDKYAKHKLENRMLAIYENMYPNYRFGKSGRAQNYGLQFFDTSIGGASSRLADNTMPGYKATSYDKDGNVLTWKKITSDNDDSEATGKNGKTIKKDNKNSSILRAFKNL